MDNQTFDITDDELLDVEKLTLEAMANRSTEGLDVLGFGEIGVPLGWPFDEPRMCVKRIISSNSQADIDEMVNGVREYIAGLEPHVDIVPTELRTIVNEHGSTVFYLVQPLIPRDELLENVLADTTPTADHPAIVAVRDASVATAKDREFSLDSQFSNFRWTDDKLSFFDVGTPCRLTSAGEAAPLPRVVLLAIPAIVRPIAHKETLKVFNGLASTRGNLHHAARSLARLGLDDWIRPVVDTFNEVIDDEPLVADDIRAAMKELQKDVKSLKNLMRAQRFWSEKVRREPYTFFITDSFTGEFL